MKHNVLSSEADLHFSQFPIPFIKMSIAIAPPHVPDNPALVPPVKFICPRITTSISPPAASAGWAEL